MGFEMSEDLRTALIINGCLVAVGLILGLLIYLAIRALNGRSGDSSANAELHSTKNYLENSPTNISSEPSSGQYSLDDSNRVRMDEINEANRTREYESYERSIQEPIDTSRMSHTDQRWVDNLRSRGYDDYDISKKMDEIDKSSCFIATASLQGFIPLEALKPLKTWRYTVLEKSKMGTRLSSWYRKTLLILQIRLGTCLPQAGFLEML